MAVAVIPLQMSPPLKVWLSHPKVAVAYPIAPMGIHRDQRSEAPKIPTHTSGGPAPVGPLSYSGKAAMNARVTVDTLAQARSSQSGK